MGSYGDRFNAAVAAELRAQRARIQITFDRIVMETGLSKSAVLNYFHGKRDIPLPALAEICRVMDVTQRAIFEAAERAVEQG